VKKLVLSILLIVSFGMLSAQSDSSEVKELNIFKETDKMPEYPGGTTELYKFLSRNLVYPTMAKEMGVQGKVYASFVIDKDGTPSGFRIVKGLNDECDKEVLRVLKLMPKWTPAELDGRKVSVMYRLPVNFKLK
jgi:protein TonB